MSQNANFQGWNIKSFIEEVSISKEKTVFGKQVMKILLLPLPYGL